MNVLQFIASLPADTNAAVAQLDGALLGEEVDPRLPENDRQRLVSERLRLMKGVKHARRKKG